MYRFLADLVLMVHLTFVIFVTCGGLLVWRWRGIVWLHVPAVIWAAIVEFTGRICPLTPLENWLRMRGGEAPYSSGFIEHYLLAVLYPEDLTRNFQLLFGTGAVVINVAIYWWLWHMQRRATYPNREDSIAREKPELTNLE